MLDGSGDVEYVYMGEIERCIMNYAKECIKSGVGSLLMVLEGFSTAGVLGTIFQKYWDVGKHG